MGVSFIGPNFNSISQMGDKLRAKAIARQAGLQLIPGYEHEVKTHDDLILNGNMVLLEL